MVALGGVSLAIRAGEVLALIGENGAGKSTLMKVMGGVVQPDEGEILVDGKPTRIDSVRKSTEIGIGFIHQELSALDNLDVAGNVFLGREPRKFGLLDLDKMRRDTAEVLRPLGLDVSPDTPVAQLSLAQRQLVEIAKALSQNARVIIMDEPTSSLTLAETGRLLELVKDLRNRGVAIVYISHRLSEVTEVADRVVGLRDGKNAGDLAREEITHDRMVSLMVGRELSRHEVTAHTGEKQVRVKVRGLRTRRYPDREVSFDVHGGEVLCLAGLVGAGRSEVAQAIFGTDTRIAGTVELDGEAVRPDSPQAAITAGVGLVPEDRRHVGLLVEWTIRENMTLPSLARFSAAGLIRSAPEREAAMAQAKSLGVKAPTVEVAAANLSGGNQQKVVLGKWLMRDLRLLILDEPTRGVDVGAKAEIYALIRELADRNVAVLMISSDMEEVLGVSTRIAVMHEGSLAGFLDRDEATEEGIMRLAVGRGGDH